MARAVAIGHQDFAGRFAKVLNMSMAEEGSLSGAKKQICQMIVELYCKMPQYGNGDVCAKRSADNSCT